MWGLGECCWQYMLLHEGEKGGLLILILGPKINSDTDIQVLRIADIWYLTKLHLLIFGQSMDKYVTYTKYL